MTELVNALSQSYFQRAILAGLLVGLTCPAIGLFLVLRRLSLIGDGLGHVAFAGVAAGWLTGLYPLFSAAVFAILGALGIERLRSWRRDYGDLALAIVFYSGIALGVVLTSLSRRVTLSLFGYLFGSLLTVTELDLWVIGIAGGIVLLTLSLLGKELFALAYDEDIARVAGLPVARLNYLIVLLAALTVVAALRVVGILLVAGMLVVPVAASLQVARSFRATLAGSLIFGVLSVLTGLVAAYLIDLAPGGAIVLASVLLFIAAAIGRAVRDRRRPLAAGPAAPDNLVGRPPSIDPVAGQSSDLEVGPP